MGFCTHIIYSGAFCTMETKTTTNSKARMAGSIGIMLLLSLLGLAANFYKAEMFFNVDFIFGGIFVMLAVKYFGKYGVLVAFIASLSTFYLWNHPYAIIIFTAEAIFTAYLLRNDRDIIIIDILYWFTLGFGIILVTYHFVMDMDMKTTLLVALKQGVNGIFNALLASLIYHGINYTMKKSGRSYRPVYLRDIFFKLLVMTASIPALIYIVFSVRHHSEDMSESLKKHLGNMYNAALVSADDFFTEAEMQSNILDGQILRQLEDGSLDKEYLDNSIKSILTASDVFRGMAYVRKDLRADSVFLKVDGELKALEPMDFSDRNYLTQTMSSEGLFYTDIHVCKGSGIPDIVTAVRAVRNVGGGLEGYIHGGIDIDNFSKRVEKLSAGSNVMYTITDREGHIVFTNNPEYKGLKRYIDRRSSGIVTDAGGGIFLWTPKPDMNVSVMTRWQNSYYITSGNISEKIPYRMVCELSLRGYVDKTAEAGFDALVIILCMIVVSVFAAWLLSRKVSFHLSKLAESTADLPAKIYRNEQPEWESSIFVEVGQLVDNFRIMGTKLSDSFYRMRQQAEELHIVLDSIPLIIFVKDTKNNIVLGNKAAADSFGVPICDVVNRPVADLLPDDAEKYYEDDLIVIRTGQPVKKIIQEYNFKKGKRIVLTDKIPIFNKHDDVEAILVVSIDITDELKQQEEKAKTLELLYQQSKMAEMGAMIGAITHQWRQPLNSVGLLAQVIISDIEDGTSDNEDIKTNARRIVENVSFMSQTVNDFSGFYRTNKEMQVFRACETMQEIYSLIDRQFLKLKIGVVFHPHEHFEVYGLKNEFKQVCLNVLNNAKEALSASDKAVKRIDVRFYKTETHGRITVTDNGGGIRPEFLPDKLFEMNTTTKEDGTGIGLYICREIVQTHMGGTLTAANTDEGAEFTITLPLKNPTIS